MPLSTKLQLLELACQAEAEPDRRVSIQVPASGRSLDPNEYPCRVLHEDRLLDLSIWDTGEGSYKEGNFVMFAYPKGEPPYYVGRFDTISECAAGACKLAMSLPTSVMGKRV